jgi:hypothetical protein
MTEDYTLDTFFSPQEWEELNAFPSAKRRRLLGDCLKRLQTLDLPRGNLFNLHCHTYFSFNALGYSPAGVVLRAFVDGFYGIGIVDFDVLDALPEFFRVSRALRLRACASLETRVYVPEHAGHVLNSPGEPGIAYFMGSGFISRRVQQNDMLRRFKTIAQRRNRGIIARLNAALKPLTLDYQRDVLPLTPRRNATERHICAALDQKARSLFPSRRECVDFWANALGMDNKSIDGMLDNAAVFRSTLRARLMKRGGVAYVVPQGEEFPPLAEVVTFIRQNGALPVYAWLDGTTDAEENPDALLTLMEQYGIEAVNIIPERNWNLADPVERERKVRALYRFLDAARVRHLPVLVGTEMNAPGQPFVDNLHAEPLQPYYDIFRATVDILHAHTLLQKRFGYGWCSAWARRHFPRRQDRYAYYRAFGAHYERLPRRLSPSDLLRFG